VICILRPLESDSASVICCNVRLADYAGTSYPSLPSLTSPRDTSVRLISAGQSHPYGLSSFRSYPLLRARGCCQRGAKICPSRRTGASIRSVTRPRDPSWTCRSHVAALINPLYQRTAVSQPLIPFSFPSSSLSCIFLLLMPLDIAFAVCATRQDVVNAVNVLRESPYVILDCEGAATHHAA